MNNIFKNAYFGKAYKTRNGERAIYLREGFKHHLYLENGGIIECNRDGTFEGVIGRIENLDIVSEWKDDKTDYLAMFASLPHLNNNKKKVDDWGYTPNLYHFDTKWHVSWIHYSEGDSLVDFMGDTPEEAIAKAYDFISELRK